MISAIRRFLWSIFLSFIDLLAKNKHTSNDFDAEMKREGILDPYSICLAIRRAYSFWFGQGSSTSTTDSGNRPFAGSSSSHRV